MRDQKDIIKEIVRRLKSSEELPYKEGAWENFRDKHLQGAAPVGGDVSKMRYWWSAAAAVLLFAVAGWWFVRDSATIDEEALQVQTEVPQKIERPNVVKETPMPSPEPSVGVRGSEEEEDLSSSLPQIESVVAETGRVLAFEATPERRIEARNMLESRSLVQLPAFDFRQSVTVQPQGGVASSEIAIAPTFIPTVLAHTNTVQQTLGKEVEEQSKAFRLTDRFSLGLVVSPSSTRQRMSFGGGLLVSYQISNKLSIRTGATFHQYEVNTLKDPLHTDFIEVAKNREPDVPNAGDLYASSSMSPHQIHSPMIPNVNAVSGFVQTIDIPLEAKYTLYKGFYANAGVSYAAVVNQKRYAHYIENVNASPFVKGLPNSEQEVQSSVTPVTRMMESENANVKTSGFGGFVNMSVGKEVKVNNKMSVSVEPFVKVPVGNFKHADMNYRNGGVRIITNF